MHRPGTSRPVETPKTPRDLQGHNCLLYAHLADGLGWKFEKGGEEFSADVTGDFRSTYGAAIVEAAAAGRGIVLEPSFLTGPYLADGRLVVLLERYRTPERSIHAVYPQGRLLPRKVRVFIDFLADAFGPEPYWDAWLNRRRPAPSNEEPASL